ncbi:Kelch repeat-containing protein [Stigmatella erecta]|uniref:Galactose oxidase, central domain n=1 Tax=Stigmatella erecta TaxID=83460 RepID=A0A1I0L719_9BACT|nr:kelch repeat-containing protein [Stigmatella erecta]SEU35526.1 Galactose oxidase, central domain [Stigmatella erecta]
MMRIPSIPLLLAMSLAILASCSPSSPSHKTGSARFIVSTRQALTTAISRITVTTSAADMPSATVDLVLTSEGWGGTIGNIPAGPERTFQAQAFDSTGTLRFEGTASGVRIWENEAVLVAISVVEVNAPPPFSNEAPFIDSLVASSLTVATGGTLLLQATAHDPNPGDSLSYEWSSADGSFSSLHTSTTQWVAPSSDGAHGLKLTVTDSKGLSSNLSLVVTVQGGSRGEVRPSLSFNSWPVVSAMTATPSPLKVGQTASVSASASDADGDTLSYAWSATCEGSWNNASSRTAQFTPTEQPGGTCNNCNLIVEVSDGQGGQTAGIVALCIGGTAPTIPLSAPYIARAFSSSDTATAHQVITYEVVAKDPQGASLSFSWAANAGTLGVATEGGSNSRITWTAPACVDEDLTPTITATVTNPFNLSNTRNFVVSGVPACAHAWASTGDLSTPRQHATATLLPSGQVLMAGGSNGTYPFTYLATAERYDPATGSWSPAGSLFTPRQHATATLLPNGKVLVAGGQGSSPIPLATAELYNPATDTWSATGSMASTRYLHMAVLLPNGKVLVAGGYDYYSGALTTAELYDPATETWSPTGSMAASRPYATATLLPNGKVLVAGGYGYYAGLAAAELYDPTTGTWSPTRSMATVRYYHTATLLPNGKVLVAGGYDYYSGALAVAELYDPASGTWSATSPMAFPRYHHSATLLPSGKVLVAGGDAGDGNSPQLNKTLLYEPGSGTWSRHGSLETSRYFHSTVLLANGQVLTAGGYGYWDGTLATAERYTP